DGDEAIAAAEAAFGLRRYQIDLHYAADRLRLRRKPPLRAAGDRLQRLAVNGDFHLAHVVELEHGLLKLRAEAGQVALARDLHVPLERDAGHAVAAHLRAAQPQFGLVQRVVKLRPPVELALDAC